MKEITASDAEETLEALLDAAGQGETFIIMRDGKQVALLIPPRDDDSRTQTPQRKEQ